MMNDTSPKKLIGFAAMPTERQREIARQGAAALTASGRRYKFDSNKAKEAAVVGWARRREQAR